MNRLVHIYNEIAPSANYQIADNETGATMLLKTSDQWDVELGYYFGKLDILELGSLRRKYISPKDYPEAYLNVLQIGL